MNKMMCMISLLYAFNAVAQQTSLSRVQSSRDSVTIDSLKESLTNYVSPIPDTTLNLDYSRPTTEKHRGLIVYGSPFRTFGYWGVNNNPAHVEVAIDGWNTIGLFSNLLFIAAEVFSHSNYTSMRGYDSHIRSRSQLRELPLVAPDPRR